MDVVTPSAAPQTISRSWRRSPELPGPPNLPEGDSNRFAKLSASLRAKLHMIRDPVTLTTLKDHVKDTATLSPSTDNADILEGGPGPKTISASDHRLRALKNHIFQDEKAEKTTKYLGVAIRTSKRVALAELIGRYIEERDARTAMPKKKRKRELPRLSPKDRFTNLLFPETQQTKEKDEEIAHTRKKAKAKLSYWIALGEPLARMSQRFGYGILDLLPRNLTDKE